jgi:hypothetical protein
MCRLSIYNICTYKNKKRSPEPPWQFVLRKLPQEEQGEIDFSLNPKEEEQEENEEEENNVFHNISKNRNKVEEASKSSGHYRLDEKVKSQDFLYCHVLDWSAPKNYIFIPR